MEDKIKEQYKQALEFATKAHGEQKRKYTNEPYINHPIAVAHIVRDARGDSDMICAALLHDTLEDTNTTFEDILKSFGSKIAFIVSELTDIYTPEAFPKLNRRGRKHLECQRIRNISNEAKTIKLADLIDNTSSIVDHDPGFAKTYLQEKEEMLKVLSGGNEELLFIARRVLNVSKEKLGLL